MISFQYQVIRYIHDRLTGEFANVGLIMYSPQTKFVKCQLTRKYRRLSEFFGKVEGHHLLTLLKDIERSVSKLKPDQTIFESIEELSSSLFPKDDSSLVFSDVVNGIDLDLDTAFYDLYQRMISKYEKDSKSAHTDQYAWKNVYKQYFDKHKITEYLEKHTFHTEDDTIAFSKSWKNGHWNCYESISFDLANEDRIKNKIYRWAGKLDELSTSDEPLELNLLSLLPSSSKLSPHKVKSLKALIETKLSDKKLGNVQVNLIKESEADRLAKSIHQEMKKSGILID